MGESMIFACYATTGKTTLAKKYPYIVDLESSLFKYLQDNRDDLTNEDFKGLPNRELNPKYPDNFIQWLKKLIAEKTKIILVSSKQDVKIALDREGIDYTGVIFDQGCEDIVLKRLVDRGNNPDYIQKIINGIPGELELYKDHEPTIKIQDDEYLEDILIRLNVIPAE